MNVLVLCPVWPSNSELWLLRMLEFMKPETTALATFAPRKNWVLEDIPTVELLPGFLKLFKKLNVTSFWPGLGSGRLLRLLQELHVDVVLCHYATTAVHFQQVWQRSKVPLLVHCHGYDVTWNCRRLGGLCTLRGTKYQTAVRRLSNRCRYIANSQFTKCRMLAIGIPEDRIDVKYLGVPLEDHARQLDFKTSGIEVLYLGRLIDCKGPDLTIQAFERACELGLDGRLTMAGGGPLFETCRKLLVASRWSERIRLLGAVDGQTGKQLRAKADIFTAHNCFGNQSGQEEAYGVAYVEAMAAGLPVVATTSGGVCETVVHGTTGLLVEPNNVEQHAQSLFRLGNTPALRHSLGLAGLERARRLFSIEKERESLFRLLNDAVDVQNPPPRGGVQVPSK